jgi:hypothetical protein
LVIRAVKVVQVILAVLAQMDSLAAQVLDILAHAEWMVSLAIMAVQDILVVLEQLDSLAAQAQVLSQPSAINKIPVLVH